MRTRIPATVGVLALIVAAGGPSFADDSAAYIKNVDGTIVTHQTIDDLPRPDRDGGDDNVAVPEPGTLALLGLGLATLGVARKRRRR